MSEKYGEDSHLVEVVKCRFLNPDGAGMILENLTQPQMTDLFDWFIDENGCRAGNNLLEYAPVLDTAIEAQAEIPFFPNGGPGEDSVADNISDGANGPASGEEFRPGQATHCEENTTAMLAYGFFGAGLLWGVSYQEYAVDRAGSPFPIDLNIADFMGHLFRAEPGPVFEEVGRHVDWELTRPAHLTLQLARIVPGLDLAIRTGYRLCGTCASYSLDTCGYGAHYRYLFFLGLLASGLRVPERSGQHGYFAPPSTEDE